MLLNILPGTAQSPSSSIGKVVSVTDWNAIGLLFVPEFFEQNRDTLVQQIGEQEFEKVKKSGNLLGWPRSMQYKPGQQKDTAAQKHYFERLSKLKVYKVASWQQYYNNQKTYRYALLRVPYAVNINWDKDSKWDTVYFIIKESALKEN
ncbi:MAG: hypothetical protein DI539_23310 [Flavobacterium psychrophilum]|nr:MAG: hypothetical protein DI539_23310 [Flavobacterium psychrophilum]